jgi:hypothetical protein
MMKTQGALMLDTPESREIFREGYVAGCNFHMALETREVNPYHYDTVAYHAWEEGFVLAGEDS